MTSIENLLAVYNAAPPDNMMRSIIKNILINVNDVHKMTIYELADACYTSPASISRLVKKLGYKNYAYFQKDVIDCLLKYEHHNRIVPIESIPDNNSIEKVMFEALREILGNMEENFDREAVIELAKEIHEHDKISIFSYGGGTAEMFLQSDLFMNGKVCDLFLIYEDIIKHLEKINKDDYVLFVVPKCIDGMDADKIVDLIHENGAKVCVVTDTKHYSVLKKADRSFVFEGLLRAVDMFALQTFVCILTMEYRAMYMD